MTRRLLNLLTALSLLLFVVVAGLWVRSYFARDAVRRVRAAAHGASVEDAVVNGDGVIIYTRTVFGEVFFRVLAQERVRAHFKPGVSVYSQPPESPARLVHRREGSLAGFYAGRYDADPRGMVGGLPSFDLWVPHWFLAAVTAPLPAVRLRRYVRLRDRRRRGLCPQCGYDVRATPQACPECGLSRPGEATPSAPTLLAARRTDAYLLATFALYTAGNVAAVAAAARFGGMRPTDVFMAFAAPLPCLFAILVLASHFASRQRTYGAAGLLAFAFLIAASAFVNRVLSSGGAYGP
jgi:hypothetical protein